MRMNDKILEAIDNLTQYGTIAEKKDLQFDALGAYFELAAHDGKQAAELANYEAAREEDAKRIDALIKERDALREAITKARIQLQATQENWREDCLFNCNDILTAALKGDA